MHRFESQLCQQRAPERGCLARPKASKPRSNSCPILDLPVEIRVEILGHIIDTDQLFFLLQPNPSQKYFWSTTPEYRKNLACLKVCKLFEAEVLSFIKVRSLRLEIERNDGLLGDRNEESRIPYRRHDLAVPLSMGHLKSHLEEIILIGNHTLPQLLDAQILDCFPRLKRLVVHQNTDSAARMYNFPEKYDTKIKQHLVVDISLQDNLFCYEHNVCTRPCAARSPQLVEYLKNEQLQKYLPLEIRARFDSPFNRSGRSSSYIDDDSDAYYPRTGVVEALRLSYLWPSKEVIVMAMDLFSQPMAMACKTRWTKQIDLIIEESKT